MFTNEVTETHLKRQHCIGFWPKVIQAALVIRGFDYLRTQKPQILRKNFYFELKLAYFQPKKPVFVIRGLTFFQESNPRE